MDMDTIVKDRKYVSLLKSSNAAKLRLQLVLVGTKSQVTRDKLNIRIGSTNQVVCSVQCEWVWTQQWKIGSFHYVEIIEHRKIEVAASDRWDEKSSNK